MMFIWLPFLFLIPLAVFWTMRPGTAPHDGDQGRAWNAQTPARVAGPDPVEIARRRLALGEITTSEYQEIRRAIG
jgi:uncharacterized membrane protein